MKTHMKHAWLVVIGCLSLAGCKGSVPSIPVGTASSSGTVDAVKLCDDYKAGQSTADGTYKGKDLTVKGHIGSIRPDPATKAKFVVLKGGDSRGVRCYFTADAAGDVEKLKSGEEIKVHGTCQGKMGSATGDSFDVELKNCKLVK